MLEKIICIDNVGVIKNGVPKAVGLQKVTLVYADNARGKSTFSSLLEACAGANSQDIAKRKTVGAISAQKVVLRFNPPSGSGAFNAEFDGVAWRGDTPDLHVFNQTFVERNVYTSTGVLPEQREGLLSLALGDAAVSQRAAFERQADIQTECAGKVKTAEVALQGYRGTLTVDQFIAVEQEVDLDARIEAIEKQIGEARAADHIANRPEFKIVVEPTFEFANLLAILKSSFESISTNAEMAVKTHLARHKGASTERWVTEGLGLNPDDECPFCGQPTGELALIRAYKTYFDESYSTHIRQVAGLRSSVARNLNPTVVSAWSSSIEFNHGVLNAWSESLDIDRIPSLDLDAAISLLRTVQASALEIIERKENNPLSALDTKAIELTLAQLEMITNSAGDYNRQIEVLNERVRSYKAALVKPDVSGLTAKRADLIVRRNRFEPEVAQLVAAALSARSEYKASESAKDTARASLDALMADMLVKFQSSINEWLQEFSAPFQVDQMAPTYKGGGVRSEYVLKVRGATVNVGPGSGSGLSFHSALSDGDKRTLAFAFFLARLFANPNRGSATVVLDDVFTSLDRHRRHRTADAILRMATDCSQVIVLGHDAYFLRDLKGRVIKKGICAPCVLALERDGEDFSYLDAFDLDEYCSSDYYKNYVLVEGFVDGSKKVKLLDVAIALRLLLEGYLHRCFPQKFSDGLMVGQMLDQIRNATSPNSLVGLQSLLPELSTLNEFASAFHHDTSGGYTRTEVNAAELLPFAKGLLGFIQARRFN